MTDYNDPAATVLALNEQSGQPKNYSALSKSSGIPISTLRDRDNGRISRKERAVDQQYLTPQEEKSLLEYVLRLSKNGYPLPVKFLRALAWEIARRRSSAMPVPVADEDTRPPGKNWPQAFYKRHPELTSRTLKAIDWKRHDHNIYDKVQDWFRVIKTELSNPAILAENVYNMDETGVLLSVLGALKVLVGREEMCKYRGAAVKRKMVTAVECLSADGRSLHPLVVWPASTHRSNWTTYPTPGWHFACSKNGYTDSTINLYWIQHVFDPQTKARAGSRPRLLISDGFAAHESLDVLKFCLANNIIPCRLPSHTSHKLQPCDVGVFSSLKTAYREQVELLYRGGANAVRLEHFTSLYSRARNAAMTTRKINAGWSKTGMFPWNPERVLKDIQPPPGGSDPTERNIVTLARRSEGDELVQTPLTPITADSLTLLCRKVDREARGWDTDSRLLIKRLARAAERAFADRALLRNDNERLLAQNNEKRTRTSQPARKVGNAKVMSYEDIVEAQSKLEAKKSSETKKRKRNSSIGCRRTRSCADDIRNAEDEIQRWGLGEYCSVISF
ncbi:uncharacterized protein N7473_011138 [Penicillium subrubescens]|uniref:HTH CENPB-type domain-containing protein n=1 Tax=Penicillium subrubescens TaxID=1316194 RepID=A0A1Q5UAK2_9EURO|nr:uncharacterized protein N7473_011138 [Penicillium subrubescens]KAJ5882704.1 hypothetical protein N7473_011138 [Penicillium subrubescens]OKP09503.1 hypothetical protein PENSUB_5152 [Penicillium subrubescens]